MCECIIQICARCACACGFSGCMSGFGSARRPLSLLCACKCAFSECLHASVCLHASYKYGLDVRVLCVCVCVRMHYTNMHQRMYYTNMCQVCGGGCVCVCQCTIKYVLDLCVQFECVCMCVNV